MKNYLFVIKEGIDFIGEYSVFASNEVNARMELNKYTFNGVAHLTMVS
jgi:hypothetical protein